MKILVVGGTWGEDKGKASGLITKLSNELKDYDTIAYNGGNYNQLSTIIECAFNYDVVFWFANVEDNSLAKIRNVKDYVPKCMLVTSKRNDSNKYSFEELLQRALANKSNLCFEFSKMEEKLFNIRVFDPLGCVWYDGTDLTKAVENTIKRIKFLSSMTRKPSVQSTEKVKITFTKSDEKFLEIVKSSAEKFHELMCLPSDVKRFVGNASLRFKEPTRCMSGFPAIRKEDVILISKRNVDKTGITEKDFVPCFLNKDENVEYFGENKPSVDSPVQVRLFKALPNIDYILHGHVYIKNATITSIAIPCGALEEVGEILKEVNTLSDFIVLNLKGHGCLVMASEKNLKKMSKVKFIVRPIPEICKV